MTPVQKCMAAALAASLLAPAVWAEKRPSADYLVYVGTYTRGKSKGIYAYRFQPGSGNITPLGLAAETPNPSWITAHPNGKFLYGVSEGSGRDPNASTISAFAIDRQSGKLTFLNKVPARGAGPCHLSVDKTGKVVLAANYGGGSIAAFPVEKDGRLREASAFVQHGGSGANPQRQRGPHAHFITTSPDNRFALVADLGLDQVLVYRFDAAKGSLAPGDPPFAKVAPGSGPRHLAFHPNGRYVYVINEIGSTVTTFSYAKGKLRELQTVSSLPEGFSGDNTTAEIHLHPNGRFLYGSNRGHDSIAVFAVDPAKGTLTLIEHVPTQGKTPRNFTLDPAGAYLFAANQASDNIVLFRIDGKTGRLTPAGKVLDDAGAPVCIEFVAVK